MECTHTREKQNYKRQHADRGSGDHSYAKVPPVKFVGHAANINTGYSERLFYGPYMTDKKNTPC